MKVIYLEDVPPSSRAGDVKDVKDGYGRNFLLPRKLAVLATQDAMQRAGSLRAEAELRRAQEAKDWTEVAEGLAETPVVLTMRAGPTGRLYGSVTAAQIAEQLSEMTGRAVNRRNVRVQAPIRDVGEFTVPVRLFEEVSADVKVVVHGDSDEAMEPLPEEPPAVDVGAEDGSAEESPAPAVPEESVPEDAAPEDATPEDEVR
jgi:large subunit ribosomal protein L9